MSDSPVPPDLDPVHGRADDPLSADRRVLAIGAAAMVGLILIGGVSAAVFTRSACGQIVADPVLPRAAGDDVAAVVDAGLAGLFDDERAALVEFLTSVEVTGRLGEVTAAFDVTGAERLAPAPDGLVAAVGATTTLLDPAAGEVVATTSVGDGHVVGSGDTLYSLALTNPGTGQTDAIVPLDRRLEGGDCYDTATVATPFAFLLGAGAGDLLLFRVEEDGGEPQLELRDAERGRIWATALQTPQIPPGISGERLDAAMDSETVVVGRRYVADDEEPVLSGFDRASGAERWTTPVSEVDEVAPAGDGPVWVEVLAVDGELAILGLARDADREAATLVAVDTADGAVRWVSDADPIDPLAVSRAGDVVTVVGAGGGGLETRRLSADDGTSVGGTSTPVDVDTGDGTGDDRRSVPAGIAELADATLAVSGSGATWFGDGAVVSLGFEPGVMARLVDAAAVDGSTVLLLTSESGAVAVAYGTP